MAQFDVYKNANKASSQEVPYLLDIQSNFLNSFQSRIVVPLYFEKHVTKCLSTLNLQFTIENKKVTASIAELSSISATILDKKITSLIAHRQDIISALDLLFTGF